MSTLHEVSIYVGPTARRLAVVSEYTFRLSLLEAGQPWSLTLWRSDRDGDNGWTSITDPDTGIKNGQVVTAAIDGDVILTGYVEHREVGDSGDGHGGVTMILSGRDLAGPAISGDADPTIALKGRRLDDALTALFAGVGLSVDVSEHADPDAAVRALRTPRRGRSRAVRRAHQVDDTYPKVGEKVWSIAERIVRRLGFRLWVAPGLEVGRCALVVDVPRNGGDALWRFERGAEGFLTARETVVTRDVPTQVTVYADAPRGSGAAAGLQRAVTNGVLLSDAVLRRVEVDVPPCPHYVESRTARSDDAARQEASVKIAEANERLRLYRVKVQGHGQAGRVYGPNTIAVVDDPLCDVTGRWLVTACTLHGLKSGGQTTELELVPEGTITTEPTSP